MQQLEILSRLEAVDPDAVFARLARVEDYPRHTDAVRTVTVRHTPDGRRESDWEVSFRDGVLCWSEEDHVDDEARILRFVQRHGDFEHFSGDWTVLHDARGCTVRFRASFDLGMASLAELLEPLAMHALRENVASILSGLFPAAR